MSLGSKSGVTSLITATSLRVLSLLLLLDLDNTLSWSLLLEGAASLHASSGIGGYVGSAVRSSLNSGIAAEGAHSISLELLFTISRLGWGSSLLNHVRRLMKGGVHAGPNLVDLLLSV